MYGLLTCLKGTSQQGDVRGSDGHQAECVGCCRDVTKIATFPKLCFCSKALAVPEKWDKQMKWRRTFPGSQTGYGGIL